MPDVISALPYLSTIKGTGGHIGKNAEDFIVEEIPLNGNALEIGQTTKNDQISGDYTVFILQKRLWSTQDAISAIAKATGASSKNFSAAGNKDRKAVTVQLISGWKISIEKLLNLQIKDLQVLGCWSSDNQINIGDLIGNRFTINIDGISKNSIPDKALKETNWRIPNYFGPQRFGSRQNNHLVGKFITQGKAAEAIMEFLYGELEDLDIEAKAARIELKENGISQVVLSRFPRRLRHEYSIIRHLFNNKTDYIGALRTLPRNLQMMFVQSYQSYLFNLLLADRIRTNSFIPIDGERTCGLNKHGFIDPISPGNETVLGRLIGYDTKPNEIEENILWKEGIEPANFRIKYLPELSMTGNDRPLFANVKDFKMVEKTADKCTIKFSLSKGSYATIALREIIDEKRKGNSTYSARSKGNKQI